MSEYSYLTLNILALGKVILFTFFVLFLLILHKRNKPWYHLVLFSSAIFIFYLIFSFPLQKMFWGNNGDEAFVFSFLTKVIHSGLGADFFYAWLPNFYPPLYFWVTGLISKLFTTSGIVAAKIGVLGTILVWFLGSYLWQKLYYSKISKRDDDILSSRWFWYLMPVVFFLILDFDAFILKPYEAVSALFGVLLIGFIGRDIRIKEWGIGRYLFFGISGGLVFLCFYFWWFALIPVLIYLILVSSDKKKGLARVIFLGLIMLIISLPYLLPLILSYIKYGLENWQAIFFAPKYLETFMPWSLLSCKGLIFILGVIGLLFGTIKEKNKFVKTNLAILIACYLYQFIGIVVFALGGKPWQPGKHLLFLGGASLAVGASYILIYWYRKYLVKLKRSTRRVGVIVLVILVIPLMPFGKFIEEPVVLYHIEEDLKVPEIKVLADFIKNEVEDYGDRTWLSSGAPEIGAYIPLSYYIAYNPHFSHGAVLYSKRMAEMEVLVSAKNPKEFNDILFGGYPKKIDSLVLYNDRSLKYYPIFFWEDNYPNGGKEKMLKLDKDLIVEKYWDLVYDKGEWRIYLKK